MKNYWNQLDTEEEVIEKKEVEKDNSKNLILWNDDVNTFDHVIDSLVEVCQHDLIQAEQCAFIVHHNGKCSVKQGSATKLKPMYNKLLNRGLTATIE